MNLTEFASELLDLDQEVRFLRAQNFQLREQNAELLKHIVDSNMASEQQLHGWIGAIMDGKLALTAGADHG